PGMIGPPPVAGMTGTITGAGALCAHTRAENTMPLATEQAVRSKIRLRVDPICIDNSQGSSEQMKPIPVRHHAAMHKM
ncbi:hypothetical protein, partial [Acidiphilium sp.]|uniref:hypothetical protein n=1 Tax=Acidiphilium sp. TaxID=527 RepID=UPI003CFF19A1